MLLRQESQGTVEPFAAAGARREGQQGRQSLENRVRIRCRGSQEAAPHPGQRTVRTGADSVKAFLGNPCDLARVGRRQAAAARDDMWVVAGQNRNIARKQWDRLLALNLDDGVPGADVMVADQPVGDREKGRAFLGGELRIERELARQLTVDDHAPGQA